MDDDGESIADFAVQQNIQLYEIAFPVVLQFVVKGGIPAAAAFDLIKKVKNDFIERHVIIQLDPAAFILHIQEDAALFLAELHQRSDGILGSIDGGMDERLLHGGDFPDRRQVRGIVNHQFGSVCFDHTVDNAGSGGDQVQVKFALQAGGDDIHMEQSEETAAESVAESDGGFRIKGEGRIIHPKLFQGILQG